MLNITVLEENDSSLLHVEHNWTTPDPIKDISDFKMELSPNRYWKVDGILSPSFKAKARITYNGKVGSDGYLDMELVEFTEDSLHLLYRENTADDWREFPYYTKNTLGASDNKFGIIDLDSLFLGEYVLANSKLFGGYKLTLKRHLILTFSQT